MHVSLVQDIKTTLFKRFTKVIGSDSIFLTFQNIAASLNDSSLPAINDKLLYIYTNESSNVKLQYKLRIYTYYITIWMFTNGMHLHVIPEIEITVGHQTFSERMQEMSRYFWFWLDIMSGQ